MTVASPRMVVGCMTGTSIDALDVALVRITGRGLEMRAETVATHTQDLGVLGTGLRVLAEQQPMTSADIATLARAFSLLHAEAVAALLVGAGGGSGGAPVRPDLICVHGQTVAHRPPVSWQLFNPWPLARAIGAPIVFDLRGADLAAGGQGAPITPIADWVLLRAGHARAVVNLGGFCNVTLLVGGAAGSRGPADVRAMDVCACNQILDALARERLGVPFDGDGAEAMRGKRDERFVTALVAMLRGQMRAARSLGTGDEGADQAILGDPAVSAQDAARSACCAIAHVIVDACEGMGELVLAGGGVRNAALVEELRAAARVRGQTVIMSDEVGVASAYREAVAFGVLGVLCQDRVAITLPAVTGVGGAGGAGGTAPISGCWVGV